MSVIARTVVAGALLAVCLLSPVPVQRSLAADNPSVGEVGLTEEARTRKALAAWEVEKKQLLGELAKLEKAMERTRWQKEKAQAYRETLQKSIGELRQGSEEMETIKTELLPVLDETLNRLKTVIENDLPFEQAERHQRLEQAEKMLSDYDSGLLIKTRALFDAAAREVEIGYSVAVSEGEIVIGKEARQVSLLRVGRVGLYALTLDGGKAFTWDRKRKVFAPLATGPRGIEEALEMVKGIRLVGLNRLPMPRPENEANIGGSTLATETN